MLEDVPGRFGPESFRPWVVSACRFGLCRFGPGSFRPMLMGRFGLIFLSPPRLRIIGRTIVWLFDESLVMLKAFFKSL